jgi:hypothetical protein
MSVIVAGSYRCHGNIAAVTHGQQYSRRMRIGPRSVAVPGAVTLAAVVLAGASLPAHRTDEFLQAARLAIDPARVQIELDLTPGIAVASKVLSDLDGDRDGAVSAAEARAYAGAVMSAVRLDVDGAPLAARVVDSTFPTVEAMQKGEGTIRLRLEAPLPPLASGLHDLRYRTGYRADIGVYLANALVPDDPRVAITDQRRDLDQRDFRVQYRLDALTKRRPIVGWWLGLSASVLALAAVWRRNRTYSRS